MVTGALHWPPDAGPYGAPSSSSSSSSSSPAASAAPPLVHDSNADIPLQHLRWAVAVTRATPSLARLFPPSELEVRDIWSLD